MSENTWTGPVVDAHAHFWDPIANDHPWLRPDVIIPLRYGDYSAIKPRYLPDDYRKDAAGHAVCETVYVETEWDPNTPLDETRYASGLSARCQMRSWDRHGSIATTPPRSRSAGGISASAKHQAQAGRTGVAQ